MNKIEKFLSLDFIEYNSNFDYNEGDLWQKIGSTIDTLHGISDVDFEILDDEDELGIDFSGKQKIYKIFFTGSSDFFPAIWIGEDDINNLEKYPVYMIDCSSNDIVSTSEGNFKNYINKFLDDFMKHYDKDDEYMKIAKITKKKLEKEFSSEIIDKGNYILKLNEG